MEHFMKQLIELTKDQKYRKNFLTNSGLLNINLIKQSTKTKNNPGRF